jgi:AcrR family transcriptional regulator
MPLARFDRLDPAKRRQLLDAAAAEFAEKGYEASSLNGILAQAGLGKSSYYYYFADKEDLYATVLEDFLARMEAEFPPPSPPALDAESFWPALEAWSNASARAMLRYPNVVALARHLQRIWRSPPPRFQALVGRYLAMTRGLLEAGRRLGCVRVDVDLDLLISVVSAADQAVDERLLGRSSLSAGDIREHARIVRDTFRRLVEPETARDARLRPRRGRRHVARHR